MSNDSNRLSETEVVDGLARSLNECYDRMVQVVCDDVRVAIKSGNVTSINSVRTLLGVLSYELGITGDSSLEVIAQKEGFDKNVLIELSRLVTDDTKIEHLSDAGAVRMLVVVLDRLAPPEVVKDDSEDTTDTTKAPDDDQVVIKGIVVPPNQVATLDNPLSESEMWCALEQNVPRYFPDSITLRQLLDWCEKEEDVNLHFVRRVDARPRIGPRKADLIINFLLDLEFVAAELGVSVKACTNHVSGEPFRNIARLRSRFKYSISI